MLRISAVSYINTKPFVYGIEHSGFLKEYSLSLDVPSVCAEKLLKGKVDIGLAPVAILPKLKEYYILPDFCIGANGPVSSVMLYSDVPLQEIKNVYLDNQSRTSVMLVQILAKHFWKIKPRFIGAKKGYETKIKETTAGVIIGDRNFSMKKRFKHVYDLSEQWNLFTGLPFVFACWISNKKLDKKQSETFYNALKFGLDNRDKVIKQLQNKYDKKLIKTYLNHSISYYFDSSKRQAMNLFLKLGKDLLLY
ncbi:MAG: menaquinone biosynthesis protein [Bacteroidetes bacterium]|nr:menaquinone biosynthesis protein [Bacteroidota bacterium]